MKLEYSSLAYILVEESPPREGIPGMTSIHTNAYKKLVERLKNARLSAGLTQVEVAEEMDLTQSAISKCESGERRVDAIELKAFATSTEFRSSS